MMDMAGVIVPKSDQINADDLIAGPMTVSITGVQIAGGTEQPVSISIAGTPKVYRPCKSMSRVLVAAWGPDASKYTGRSLTLYRDPKVKWGGMEVGGIRISHMTHIDREMTMMLTMTKQNRAPHKVKVLTVDAPKPAADTTAAKAAAAKGTIAFKAWWAGASADDRTAATAIKGDLKALCDTADAAIAADPFGLPPLDAGPTPTESEIAAAQAEREFAAERERENAAYTTK